MNKNKYGQFYTTNYKYILKNLEIPKNIKNIIEPFAGNGDLIKFLKKEYKLECYDIEPKKDYIIKRDTLINPPDYKNKFILTNPPYLARNKNSEKKIYNKYDCNDLYKCFLISIINSECKGGIIIVPLNFISSVRKADIELRRKFLNKYNIITMNIFEEQVFYDTSYTVCSFLFTPLKEKKSINIFIYPSKKNIDVELNEGNNYSVGGEIYNLKKTTKYKITRATKKNNQNISNILLKCIDDNEDNKINLKIVSDKDKYIDNTEKLSARSYASLVISPPIDISKQKKLVKEFNNYIDIQRKKYNSLFLSNYRESKNIARKRISFSLAFKICNFLLNTLETQND